MTAPPRNSFGGRASLRGGNRTYEIYRLDALERRGLPVARLPYSLKILLENLLRREDGTVVRADDVEKLARWDPKQISDDEIAFMPARVLMQDFTGVPAVVDLAAMRDAMRGMGGELFSRLVDTTNGETVAAPSFGVNVAMTPNFSPDGSRVAFNNHDASAAGRSTAGTPDPPRGAQWSAWHSSSPNGSSVT